MKVLENIIKMVTYCDVEVEKVTKVGETYLCEICGNKVKVIEAGKGTLVCCGKPMKPVK
jgi:superoxide reductase